jgi:hypothetical protein
MSPRYYFAGLWLSSPVLCSETTTCPSSNPRMGPQKLPIRWRKSCKSPFLGSRFVPNSKLPPSALWLYTQVAVDIYTHAPLANSPTPRENAAAPLRSSNAIHRVLNFGIIGVTELQTVQLAAVSLCGTPVFGKHSSGLPKPRGAFPGLGPHSFRPANITWRQEVGGSSIEASKIAGHTSVGEKQTAVMQ